MISSSLITTLDYALVSNPDSSLFRSAGCGAGDAIHPALWKREGSGFEPTMHS